MEAPHHGSDPMTKAKSIAESIKKAINACSSQDPNVLAIARHAARSYEESLVPGYGELEGRYEFDDGSILTFYSNGDDLRIKSRNLNQEAASI